MNYLLIGGAGFIGTHLAKRLIADGHDVTIVDNLATSTHPNYQVNFIEADARSAPIEPAIQQADIIYFLAGSLGVEYIDRNPKSTLDNNIGLMTRLIPLFEKHNKKVIFSSTSEVYGNGPFSEDNDLTIGPPSKLRWGYAAAKLITEFMITANTFPYTIVRFFNVVGPGQLPDYGMVMPRFIEAAKNNKDLTVYGTGEQIRSFCHVVDAVEYLRRIEHINGEIFNLGSGIPITIKQLAERVIALSNSQSQITFVPYNQAFSKHHGDIDNRVPDLTKLKYMTGYLAQYELDDIIKDCL
jgi:UDP-glucose 4-epimerase